MFIMCYHCAKIDKTTVSRNIESCKDSLNTTKSTFGLNFQRFIQEMVENFSSLLRQIRKHMFKHVWQPKFLSSKYKDCKFSGGYWITELVSWSYKRVYTSFSKKQWCIVINYIL